MRVKTIYLSGNEYQQDYFRDLHLVNQARKEFWFVSGKQIVPVVQPFETYGELNVAGSNNILDFEFGKGHVIAKLHYNLSEFS